MGGNCRLQGEVKKVKVLVDQLCPTLLQPHGLL